MDVRTEAGDVFELDAERILIYGMCGIALKLGQRNLDTMRRVARTQECVKDTDMSDRRFTVAYDQLSVRFRFEIVGGEVLRVEAWQILPEVMEKMVA